MGNGPSRKAWRPFERSGSWTDTYATKLIDDINKISVSTKEIETINILLVGPIKAGKSSFINTVASIDNDRITQCADSGGAVTSLTKQLDCFKPQGKLKNFKFFDIMGMEGRNKHGINNEDFMTLVNGHVNSGYKFRPATPIKLGHSEYKKKPTVKDKVHCVVFVIDSNILGEDNMTISMKDKIKDIQTDLEEGGTGAARIILLTQIDKLCKEVHADITNTYTSTKVQYAVNMAEGLFNVPTSNIFPVQNYSDEVDNDHQKEILILLALRQMMRFAADKKNYICKENDTEDKKDDTEGKKDDTGGKEEDSDNDNSAENED